MMTTTYDDLTVTYDQSTLTYQGLPAQFDGVAFVVEMAFGYAPLDTSPQWETVTAYVRGFSTNRGRNSEFVDYSPGTASIRLDNRDRRFDPEYVSGPFYGELNPMVPVRIQATYSGVTYTLFYGFVQGWPTAYNTSNTDAVATVNCVDATRLLGNLALIQSEYIETIVADSPALYFPFQEDGLKSEPLVGIVIPYTYQWTTANRSMNNLYPVAASKALVGSWRITPSVVQTVTDVICFWIYLDEGTGIFVANTSRRVALQIRPGSTASSLQYSLPSFSRVFSGTQVLDLSVGWHFVVLDHDSSGFTLYVDNVSVWTGTTSNVFSPGSFNEMASSTSRADAMSHLAMFNSITTAKIAEYWELGTAPFEGELSSDRLTRALDDAGWPAGFRDIETGVQPVGSYRPESLPVVRYMEQVESAEQGALFVNAAGEVEFQSRTTAETPVIAALFDDSGVDLPFAGVSVDAHTVDAIRNNVVVNYANGSTTSTDAGSVAAYGTATQTVDAQLVDDPTVAQSIGDNLLARAKDPRTRITSLQVNMRRDPANLIPAVASLDLADDVVVSLTPTGVGDPLWRAVSVQGLSHTVTPQSWDVTMYLGPGPVATNGPLMVLDDAVYGQLDNNKLG